MTTVFEPRLAVCFAVVAEHKSFTGAAELMGLSQPSISEQILKLESQLGFSLFARTSRAVELTVEGIAFLPHAQRITHAHNEGRRFIDMVRSGVNGTLRLGTLALTREVPERIALIDGFVAAAPWTRLEIVDGPHSFREMLRAGEVDAFIGFYYPTDSNGEFEMRPIHRSIAHLLVPTAHRLAESTTLAIQDLPGERLVTFPRGDDPALYDLIYTRFAAAGVQLVQGPESNRRTIEDFARARGHLTIKWRSIVAARKLLDGVIGIPMSGAPLTTTLALFRKRDSANPAVDLLWQMATSYAPEPREG
ncbi:LysR family transcriptional regulator [Sphingomonas immobilis]|uniref:LysR family transcriptional regulator n=1 Tax=Sphingomonas immobilis TaxID=3063997 RepID=A0ABT9A2S6_9SPHN|nr:LysR family transcriptional regulator [Sphingomonas sp. CA1-15]MDO7843634.1 LysR family transcriptional regulator [Sphingomonas sp. CA1-15]